MADPRVIVWSDVQSHLLALQRRIDAQLRRAQDPERLVLQGRAQLVEELLKLPETLEVLEAEK